MNCFIDSLEPTVGKHLQANKYYKIKQITIKYYIYISRPILKHKLYENRLTDPKN